MLRTGELIAQQFKKSPKWIQMSNQQLQELKLSMLEIADDFIDVCNKYHLQYLIAYGTALGAVRHNGFIPWDDDMDFYMPRKDYMEFLNYASEELNSKYWIRSISKGDDVRFSTIHIRKKGTRYVNYGDIICTSNEPEEMRGIYIDIFPLDNAPDNKILRKINGWSCLAIQFAISCISTSCTVDWLNKENLLDDSARKAMRLKWCIGKVIGVISIKKWLTFYDRFSSKNHNENSNYITCYVGYKNLRKATFKRKEILPSSVVSFEGRQWSVAGDYDYYLSTVYGDYMKMPDAEHQRTHPVFELEL